MTSIAHALVAGAIATRFPHPVIAPTLALASHFLLDAIPHWDFGTNWRKRAKWMTGAFAVVETLCAIALAWYIFSSTVQHTILIVTIIASLIPDWLEAPWYIFFAHAAKIKPGNHASFVEKMLFRIYKTQNKIHSKAPFPLGVLTQIVTVIVLLFLLLG